MEIFGMTMLMLLGVLLLLIGANLFVDGAAGIAKKLNITAFVIGMTVVAVGTSAPELAVSIKSAYTGTGDVLMGNIIGSNIYNILLILGITALIAKLPVQKNTLVIEIPFLIGISVLFLLFGVIGGQEFSRLEGGLLIALYAVYLGYMIMLAQKERKRSAQAALSGEGLVAPVEKIATAPAPRGPLGLYKKAQGSVWFLLLFTAAGLTGIIFGANLVVDNVNILADSIDNENARKILSVTVVAVGTSLPELVTSVTAAVKGNTDIALGNIIGSNIANLLLIGGLPMLMFTVSYPSSYLVDILVSIAAAAILAICVLIGRGKHINRIGGAIMLTCAAAYTAYLFFI